MPFTIVLFFVFAVAFLGYFISSRGIIKLNGVHLPPGPIGLPLIGNVLQLRDAQPHKALSRLRRRYGDLFYCRIFGRDIIVISSEKVARDLFDKRSTSFSGRPSAAAFSAMGFEFHTGFIGYTDTWRMHRRFYHDAFRRDFVSQYHSSQLRRAHVLLENLVAEPENYEKHLQTFSASVILSAVYGYEAAASDDTLVTMVEHVDKLLTEGMTSFEVLLAVGFPFLLSTPAWMPDFGVKKAIASVREEVQKTVVVPYEYTKAAMMNKAAGMSMVGDVIWKWEDQGPSQDTVTALKGAAFTAYIAGAETTQSTLLTFMYVMLTNPDVQARVQEQIDAVVEETRLPDLRDRPSLPLVDAILRETIRWAPATPMGLPHSATEDDVYEGYFIPKGSFTLVNVWEIFHDAARYTHPDTFAPDRFLHPDGTLTDDTSYTMIFGFGRRVCPGQYFADNSLWLAMACVLAMFKISKAKNEKGEDIEPDAQWITNISLRPTGFRCSITPRSKNSVSLLHSNPDASNCI